MARPTHCIACKTAKIEQRPQELGGAPRKLCAECLHARMSERKRRYYNKAQRGQAWWIKRNKQIARNWRKRNQEHIRLYVAERRARLQP